MLNRNDYYVYFSLDDEKFNCARKVSTILCVHEVECSPLDCSGHGTCKDGKCLCNTNWAGSACDRLKCQNDCSQHGTCTEGKVLVIILLRLYGHQSPLID